MDCPECGKDINVGRMIGSISTAKKAAASRANGRRGGRPKSKLRSALPKGGKKPKYPLTCDKRILDRWAKSHKEAMAAIKKIKA